MRLLLLRSLRSNNTDAASAHDGYETCVLNVYASEKGRIQEMSGLNFFLARGWAESYTFVKC